MGKVTLELCVGFALQPTLGKVDACFASMHPLHPSDAWMHGKHVKHLRVGSALPIQVLPTRNATTMHALHPKDAWMQSKESMYLHPLLCSK